MSLAAFPVAKSGQPQWSDAYFGVAHHGVDIFAMRETPLLACAPGDVAFEEDPKGGHVAFLHGDDGRTYYYAHLAFFEGMPRRVAPGDVIGYVGTSGNARGKPPHLHFEIHPGGRADVYTNPGPELRELQPLDVAAPPLPPLTVAPLPGERAPAKRAEYKPPRGGSLFWIFLGLALSKGGGRRRW